MRSVFKSQGSELPQLSCRSDNPLCHVAAQPPTAVTKRSWSYWGSAPSALQCIRGAAATGLADGSAEL
jgi:hypothetical protein